MRSVCALGDFAFSIQKRRTNSESDPRNLREMPRNTPSDPDAVSSLPTCLTNACFRRARLLPEESRPKTTRGYGRTPQAQPTRIMGWRTTVIGLRRAGFKFVGKGTDPCLVGSHNHASFRFHQLWLFHISPLARNQGDPTRCGVRPERLGCLAPGG